MQRSVWPEVVTRGGMDSYKEWFSARNRIFEDLGIAPWQMYRVRGRTNNLVCVMTPEVLPEEATDEFWDKIFSDERLVELTRQRHANPDIIDGTQRSSGCLLTRQTACPRPSQM